MDFSVFLILLESCFCTYTPIYIPENLNIYQNLTSISDEKLMEVYRKGTSGFYAETYPKFYYQLSSGPSTGTVSPVVWNVQKGIRRQFVLKRVPTKKT